MLIEERESANSISQEEVSDAIDKMMDARMICHIGRVTDALAHYDTIGESIAANPFALNRKVSKVPMQSTSMLPPQP